MRKIHIVSILIYIILIVSDIFIGFYGHYMGSTDGEFTWEAVGEYFSSETTWNQLFIIFIVATIIVGLLHWKIPGM